MADGFTITHATAASDIAAVKELCWAYRQFLFEFTEVDRLITETFYPKPKYAALMEGLEAEHARPNGAILLARLADGTPVGCGMIHAISPDSSEIKRVFVTDRARGHGVADAICSALIDQARADGFSRMVLDTSKTLSAAQRLYTKLGFVPCAPYQSIPEDMLPHLLFYEKAL